METLTIIQITVAIVIAVAGSFSLILGFFALFMNFLLNAKINPLEKRIEGLEAGQAKLNEKLDKLLAKQQ